MCNKLVHAQSITNVWLCVKGRESETDCNDLILSGDAIRWDKPSGELPGYIIVLNEDGNIVGAYRLSGVRDGKKSDGPEYGVAIWNLVYKGI